MLRRCRVFRCGRAPGAHPDAASVHSSVMAQELEAELRELEQEQAARSPRLFRQGARTREPLISRWWVPYVCVAGIIAIWTPDRYKVGLLFYIDDTHDAVKLWVHKQYWRWTMPPDQYAILMEQLVANVPKSERVKASDCPL